MIESDFLSKAAIEKAKLNLAVCLGLKENKRQEDIAELLNVDSRTVRNIKKAHCPECGIPSGKHGKRS